MNHKRLEKGSKKGREGCETNPAWSFPDLRFLWGLYRNFVGFRQVLYRVGKDVKRPPLVIPKSPPGGVRSTSFPTQYRTFLKPIHILYKPQRKRPRLPSRPSAKGGTTKWGPFHLHRTDRRSGNDQVGFVSHPSRPYIRTSAATPA